MQNNQLETVLQSPDQSNLIDGEVYTKGKSTNLYEYDNTLLGVVMTGMNPKRFIEWSYSYFNQCKPGDITVSFKKGAPAYLYDQFDGDIEFTVDLSKPSLEMDENNAVMNEGSRVNITSIAGGSLTTIIMVWGLNMPASQFMNMPLVGLAVVNALAGSVGIVLTIPFTAFLAPYVFKHP